AADAITGKTITGGTITGAVLQTATSGERITINEAGANKVIIYNSSGTAIGELSDRGLLLEGNNGALLYLDPDSTYPNLRFTNDDQSNEAVINVVETTAGAADLGLNSGQFTGSGYSDMKWRTFFGSDFWVAERLRDSNNATVIGGRVHLDGTTAQIGFLDTTNVTPDTLLNVISGLAQVSGGRLQVVPPDSSSSAVYVDAAVGYTGNLLRLTRDSTDRFKVDKDGLMTASNIVTGSVTITPVANTPTSINVTGLNLSGTVHRAFVTAQSAAPGTVVECSATSVTATGLTIWVNRTNTTNTSIWYLVIAS
ncbi:hypothetical protein, partial [Streptomyces sp. NBC_00878]|uniref:hypothetical protein n=1 Tax=Streptomyces sp. NBC_00878 TaxID=2975854 RepID=UPI002255E9F1